MIMKISMSLLVLALTVLGFASCNKDDVAKKNEIEGTWEGAWGFDSDDPSYYEKWVIEKDGDLVAYDEDGVVIARGSWTVDGLDFEAEYTSEFSDFNYTFVGLYHDILNEIIGTWGETPSHTDGGTFEMYKQ
jgi:hypothetical protein